MVQVPQGRWFRSGRPEHKRGFVRAPRPRPRPPVWILFFALRVFFLFRAGPRTQVTAAPELRCGGEAPSGTPPPALSGSGAAKEMWRRWGYSAPDAGPALEMPTIQGAQAPRPRTFPHPAKGSPQAFPSVPWGWSLTGSGAGAPTLAAAIHTERRGGRKRERGGGEGDEGGGPGAYGRGGEGRPLLGDSLSCPCPTPRSIPCRIPASLLTLFPPWIPLNFSGIQFSYSLPSPESLAPNEGSGEGSVCYV